jgi:hypothetical protein
LPGYLYEAVGWQVMITVFFAILGVSAWSMTRFDAFAR